MASTATGIILVTGTITFANEWYNTHTINFRVPVATVLIAAIFEGLSKLDANAATGVAFIAAIGAVTTKFNGRSVADTLASIAQSKGTPIKTG